MGEQSQYLQCGIGASKLQWVHNYSGIRTPRCKFDLFIGPAMLKKSE